MTIKDLLLDHDYYCSDGNYYSNDANLKRDTMTEFLDDMEESDVDMNLVFRWDIKAHTDENGEPDGSFYAEVFIIKQRKGIFMPCYIDKIEDHEVDRFIAYLKKHKEKLDSIWSPL